MSSAAIRQSIVDAMHGAIYPSIVRRVTPGTFLYGVFDGQPIAAQQAGVIDTTARHRFDVVLTGTRPHKATPISTKASYRIEARPVQIRVYTHLESSANEAARAARRSTVEADCQNAISVLCYPGILNATLAGASTNIVNGMICGADDGTGYPRWEATSEDWRRQIYTSRIVGTLLVRVPHLTV